MLERAPFVDIVVGPQTYHRLPELLHRRVRGGRARDRHRFSPREQVRPAARGPVRALGRVSVPHRAGRLRPILHLLCRPIYARRRRNPGPRWRSWPKPDSLSHPAREKSRCSARTSTRITARGRTVAAWSLARLIAALADLDGLARIRYTTSHPRDMSHDLIEAHGHDGQADAVPAPAGAIRPRMPCSRR